MLTYHHHLTFSAYAIIKKILGFSGWAAEVLALYWFQQIQVVFHPEDGSSTIGDKCHQLWAGIMSLNETAEDHLSY